MERQSPDSLCQERPQIVGPCWISFPEGKRIFTIESLYAYYHGFWNNCNILNGMSNLNVSFISNSTVKIKLLENGPFKPVTPCFQTLTLIICSFIGKKQFFAIIYLISYFFMLDRLQCSFLAFSSHFYFPGTRISSCPIFLSWRDVILSSIGFNSTPNTCGITKITDCKWLYLEFDMIKIKIWFFFKLGFTPCKAEQPLRGMEVKEKEARKG